MILSDKEIRNATSNKQLTITPHGHINPAGVDLRIDRNTTLKPHQHQLAATVEYVELSNKLAGILHIRSSLAREGVFASLALVDPGYRGQLTVSLYNAGARPVKLKQGERFIQLSILRLDTPSRQTYSGKYQDSRGVVASKRRRKSYAHRTERVIHAPLGKGGRAY
jgi:dCTP deaminase